MYYHVLPCITMYYHVLSFVAMYRHSGKLSRQKFHHCLAREFTVGEIAEINLKSEIGISYSLKLAQYRKILKRSPSICKPLHFNI